METPDLRAYLSVDVEASGPTPGLYSLLAIGACRVDAPDQTFYAELKPQSRHADPQAMAIHGLDLDTLERTGLDRAEAMAGFEAWILAQVPPPTPPVFVSYNAPFDWMFISDAFHQTLGRNPFGHFPLDIRALYMGMSGRPWKAIRFEDLADRYLGRHRLNHNALEDAQAQGELFHRLMDEWGQVRGPRPASA
jgi:ribonuclease T